jgi:hypothetical protein
MSTSTNEKVNIINIEFIESRIIQSLIYKIIASIKLSILSLSYDRIIDIQDQCFN